MKLCKDCFNCRVVDKNNDEIKYKRIEEIEKNFEVTCTAARWFDSKGNDKKIPYINENGQYFESPKRYGEKNPCHIKDCEDYEGE